MNMFLYFLPSFFHTTIAKKWPITFFVFFLFFCLKRSLDKPLVFSSLFWTLSVDYKLFLAHTLFFFFNLILLSM